MKWYLVLLGVIGVSWGDIHNPDLLMDEIYGVIQPFFKSSIILEDFSFQMPCGFSVACYKGSGRNFTNLSKQGKASVSNTGNNWNLMSGVSLYPFTISYEECLFKLGDEGFPIKTAISGHLVSSSGIFQADLQIYSDCSGTIKDFKLLDAEILLDETKELDILRYVNIYNNLTTTIKSVILDNVGLNLYNLRSIHFNNLKNCN